MNATMWDILILVGAGAVAAIICLAQVFVSAVSDSSVDQTEEGTQVK